MAISVVQSTGGTRSGSGSNYSLAFTSNVTAGNLLVVTVARWQGGSGTGTMTDTQGNTYTRHVGISSASNETNSIWSATAGSSGSCTVTFTPPSATFIALGLTEVAGTTSVGSTGSVSGSSELVAGPSTVTLSKQGIVFGVGRWGAAVTITPATGWTQIYEDQTFTNVPNSHIYRIETSYAGPLAPAWVCSVAATTAVCVAFESNDALPTQPTKLYLTNASAPYTPATIRGSWNSTGFAATKALGKIKGGGGVSATQAVGETSATNGFKVLMYRGISGGLPAQTIGGTVDLAIRVYSDNVAAHDTWYVYLYITQGDSDTPRGTLLDYSESAGTNEWPASSSLEQVLGLNTPQTLSSLAIQLGDRLVAEIGYAANNTSTTNMTGRLLFGSADSGGVGLNDAAQWTNGTVPGSANLTAQFLMFSSLMAQFEIGANAGSYAATGADAGFNYVSLANFAHWIAP